MSGAQMVMEGEKPMVEVAEPPAQVEEKVTVADLKENGFTPEEIAVAKKEGMISEDEPNDDQGRGEDAKKNASPQENVTEDDREDTTAKAERPAPAKDEDDKEKNEQEYLSKMNPKEQGLYFKGKKEKLRRQRAEAERDQMVLRNNLMAKRMDELSAKIDAIAAAKKDNAQGEFKDLLEDDETPKPKDEKQYLTREDLEKLEQEKAEKAKTADEEKNARARVVYSKVEEFAADARERYSDFEATLGLANEVVEKTVNGTLSDLVPDVRTQRKVESRVREFLTMLGNADRFTEEEYNPADLGYEIGQLHPNYGKNGTSSSANANGNNSKRLTPEELERMERNANKRQTSAGIGGGSGRRLVSLDDITVEQALNLPPEQYAKLPAKVRERLLQE